MIQCNTKFARMGRKLISTLPEFEELRSGAARIVYLESDEEKTKDKKIVLGDCAKVAKRYAWCCPYDFMITVYTQNCAILNFDDDKYRILLRHELHHVGIDNDGDEPSFYIVPHDVEEFDEIIKECGLHWDR